MTMAGQIITAQTASAKFYAAHSDLEPYGQEVQRVALRYMQDPAKAKGRPLEACLEEIAVEARELLGTVPAQPATPAPTGDPNAARAAPGGKAGGAGRTPPAQRPAAPAAANPVEDYTNMRENDQAPRILGGTRAAKSLEKVKV
jgi:hypothetical protein